MSASNTIRSARAAASRVAQTQSSQGGPAHRSPLLAERTLAKPSASSSTTRTPSFAFGTVRNPRRLDARPVRGPTSLHPREYSQTMTLPASFDAIQKTYQTLDPSTLRSNSEFSSLGKDDQDAVHRGFKSLQKTYEHILNAASGRTDSASSIQVPVHAATWDLVDAQNASTAASKAAPGLHFTAETAMDPLYQASSAQDREMLPSRLPGRDGNSAPSRVHPALSC